MNRMIAWIAGSVMVLFALIPAAHAYQGMMCCQGGGCGGSSGVGGAAGSALLLLALAAGYLVFLKGEVAAKGPRIIGRVVAVIIAIVAVGGLICSAWFGWCKTSACPTTGTKMSCPHTSKKMMMDCHPGMKMRMPAEQATPSGN